MNKKSVIIVTKNQNQYRTYHISGNKAEHIFISEDSSFPIGSIYLGRVQSVKKDLKAAFIDLGKDTVGFLPFSEINFKFITNRNTEDNIHEGDTIAVMIAKEAIKTKPVSLTCKLSIQGNYCVIHSAGNALNISSKLDNITKNKLKDALLTEFTELKHGTIIRTNAANTDITEIKNEINKLGDILSNIYSIMPTRSVYSCLYKPVPAYIEQIRNISVNEYDEIITDDDIIYSNLINNTDKEVKLYKDSSLSLNALYSLEKEYTEATSKKVYLKSGGYIIIEPCEALTVIDVNSGKASAKDKDHIIDIINREAAQEIVHQLILRNISGIIIIDFINYNNKQFEQDLLDLLKKLIKKDSLKTKLIDITPLGLVELTRQKKYSSIYDNINKIYK